MFFAHFNSMSHSRVASRLPQKRPSSFPKSGLHMWRRRRKGANPIPKYKCVTLLITQIVKQIYKLHIDDEMRKK